MHRSSQSIAAIATALAKAQTALVNPEKTMTATIRDDRRGQGAERNYRYASLSSGLDLVRKALGEHEIALIQTTELDEPTRTVRLNTVLAHSSGEWIASDWPVCPMSDMNAPQRMGAALTYARRYAMFTLVGIAGEDDLDAPDLNVVNPALEPTDPSLPTSSPIASGSTSRNRRVGAASRRMPEARAPRPVLAPDESARLRDGMIAEIESLASSDAATEWATSVLARKNTLTAGDARNVESAFEIKLAGLATDLAADGLSGSRPDFIPAPNGLAIPDQAGRERTPPITKIVRHRNKEHLRFVRLQPCLVCAKQPSDPHHLPFAQPRALGRKVSDEFTVPLCRAHHREVHRVGKEINWWQALSIAPLAEAEKLWQKSQSGHALSEPMVPLTEPVGQRGRRASKGNGKAHTLAKPSAL